MNKILLQTRQLPRSSWIYFKTSSRSRKIIIVIVILIFVILLLKSFTSNNNPKYLTAIAKKASITEIVTETGNITTNGKIDVYSPTNGFIREIYVTNEAFVSKGDELFLVESSATEQERSQALANYLSAKSTLETAKATRDSLQADMFDKWNTYKQLAESDSYENQDGTPKNEQRNLPAFHIAEKAWLGAEKNFQKQQLVINQAQASVTSTYLLYQATLDAVVKATATGTVANLAYGIGGDVKFNSPTNPSQPVLSVKSSKATEAKIQLSESDISKVKVGQKAVFDIGDVPEKVYRGVVVRVDSIGTDQEGVIRYNAYLEVINPDTSLIPGMTADIEIITKEVKNTLSVPNSAVKPYRGGKAVRVIDPKSKEVVYIPVRVGVRGENTTQILSGISEGQEVITALPNDQLKRPGIFPN